MTSEYIVGTSYSEYFTAACEELAAAAEARAQEQKDAVVAHAAERQAYADSIADAPSVYVVYGHTDSWSGGTSEVFGVYGVEADARTALKAAIDAGNHYCDELGITRLPLNQAIKHWTDEPFNLNLAPSESAR